MAEKRLSEELRFCLETDGCGDCKNHEHENILTCPKLLKKAHETIKRYEDLEEQCNKDNYVSIQAMLMKFKEFMSDMHELCEYQELEEQGKLIKLKWAAGDTYFEIEKAFWIDERMCRGCRYYYNCCIFEDYEENEGKYPSCVEIVEKRFKSVKEIVECMEDDYFGKTVFSTHEEAEAVLRELKEKGEGD